MRAGCGAAGGGSAGCLELQPAKQMASSNTVFMPLLECIPVGLQWSPTRMDETMPNFHGFNRRSLFRRGGLLAAAQVVGGSIQKAVAAPLELGANLYRSIGVRPLINARG